ncbi:Hint domain-containing protein [Defluviimonas sp. SAOS-178_SWC]|uniref:Hint domain-containing protein n=1 Tax=Defluviimonas sp. SAOS-178_SWC TaxID=3121287 RepID=UPI00322150E4
MATYELTAQKVNGDPFLSGGNIVIVNNSFTSLVFLEVDNTIDDPLAGEFVSLDGGLTWLSYDYLGSGAVRGDPTQSGAFLRIDMGNGTFQTVAIDLNADGDGVPDLSNGNTQLTVAGLNTTAPQPWPVPPCFVAGTLIAVPGGERPAEEIAPGDLVETLDHGPQVVRWAGRRRVSGFGRVAPIRIAAGVLGNDRTLLVSPQHRMLVRGGQAELLFGEPEVLVAAKHLVGVPGIAEVPVAQVEYVHLMFDRHEIVFAEGAPSESFHPGSALMERDRALLDEILSIFPEFAALVEARVPAARRILSEWEARALAA